MEMEWNGIIFIRTILLSQQSSHYFQIHSNEWILSVLSSLHISGAKNLRVPL